MLLATALVLWLSLISYQAGDPSWNTATGAGKPKNLIGSAGSYLSDLLLQTFGLASFFIPILILMLSWKWLRSEAVDTPVVKSLGAVVAVLASASALTLATGKTIYQGAVHPGGVAGIVLAGILTDAFNITGAIIVLSTLLILALWWLYNRTEIGLQARATMQNATMARALGVNTDRIYMLTFSLGAGLAGMSGALLAPTTSIQPFMGQQFVAPAFITVVVGGAANVIAGALSSSLLLSLVKTPVGFLVGAFLGTVALLLAALVIIRLIPDGISAPIQRWLDRDVRAR